MGRIDFDEPLAELVQRGWRFQETAPIPRVRDGGCWAVIGDHGEARVRADCSEQREAWAEVVRLALLVSCDGELARLRLAGWSFSEHPTARQSGRVGWVISGSRGDRRIQVVDDDRLDAWGEALILVAVAEPLASESAPSR